MGIPIPTIKRVLVPEGNYPAVCVAVIDLGTQELRWEDSINFKRRVRVTFEIPGERRTWEFDGEQHEGPSFIGKEFTLSLHKNATLRRYLKTWGQLSLVEGSEDGISEVLGAPALVTVQHEEGRDEPYASLAAVTPMPEGMEVPKTSTEWLEFSLSQYDQEVFDAQPVWIREKIERSPEGQAISAHRTASRTEESLDDSIPFALAIGFLAVSLWPLL